MAKYRDLNEYIDSLNQEALKYYIELSKIIDKIKLDIKSKLFAGQVAFYVEENLKHTFHSSPVIVMSFYNDHVNIFAKATTAYKDKLPYKFTKKDTLQIYFTDTLHEKELKSLFKESLV